MVALSLSIQVILWLSALLATLEASVHVIDVVNYNGVDDPSCYSGNGGPCKTLNYALINGLASSTTIMIHKGVYHLSIANTSYYNLENFAMIGAGYDVTTFECDFGAGLGFFNTDNLVLANFTLLGGGKIMNSTSVNTTTGEAAVFRVALYLSDCTDVTIDGLKITNSIGTGMAMFDVTGKVEVKNSVFQFSKSLDSEELPGGGGAFIEFTYCKSGVLPPCDKTLTSNTMYNVQNCSFISNIATFRDTRIRPLPVSVTRVHQFGYGGGLHFMLRGISRDNTITIQDCKFLNNSAVWGGGLSIVFLDFAKKNRVTITNVHFEGNFLPYSGSENTTATGGGAIQISLLPSLPLGITTSIAIINCTFVNNSALFGGGLSFELKKENEYSTTSIYIANCTWCNNVGRLGSAMDVYSHTYPLGEPANFTIDSCNFIDNTNLYTDLIVKPLGLGTVYSWSVPVELKNKNLFIGNHGSALVGVSTQYHFQSGAVVVFENNTAENGGAITMLENSNIILYDNVELNFTCNVVSGKGGAIHVVNTAQRNFLSGHHCFVVYKDLSVSPYKWKDRNIKVFFDHNSAKYGNSIFVTSLLPCVWEEVAGLQEIDMNDVHQVFYWDNTFHYEGVSNVTGLINEISSEAVYVHNFNVNEKFPPGKLYNFKFSLENDKKEKAEAIYFVTTNDSTVAVVDDAETYSDGYTRLYGEPHSVFDVKLTTTNNLPLSIQVTVELDDCPPGFYTHGSSPNETVCKCSVSVSGKDYIGIVSCDSKKLVAYLKEGYYAGYINISNRNVLFTSSCLPGYCKDQGSYIELPSNSSNSALDNLICKPQHRTGMLCGKCAEGSYIYANSLNFKCGPCNVPVALEVVYYIFAKCFALGVFILFIGILNISLVNGPLNSFILFSQLLPYMDIYAGDRIIVPNQSVVLVYRFLYGIWNLNFLETIAVPYICLHKTQSALIINILDLIPVVLATIVTVVIHLLGHFNCCNTCRYKSSEFARRCLIKVVGRMVGFGKKVINFRCIKSVISSGKKCLFNGKSDSSLNSDQLRSIHATSSRVSRPNNNPGGNTVLLRIGPLLTIIVLCYARVTAFSFVSLSYSTLYGPSKDGSNDTLTVFRYDGTMDYKLENFYFILSGLLAVSLVLLIPFFLIVFPCCRIYKHCHICPCKYFCCCCCVREQLLANNREDENDQENDQDENDQENDQDENDQENDQDENDQENDQGKNNRDEERGHGYKYRCICSKQAACTYDSFYINKIFDAVQECYKDTNCVVARISAFYLLYRIIILGIYAFSPSIELQYLLQSICFVLMLIVQSAFQPYKDDFYNAVDTCMFGNLALISAISYYRLYSDAQDLTATNKAFVIQTILIYLPILYLVFLCCWKAYKMYKQERCANTDEREQLMDQY